jgi:hypothetical protein
MKWHTMDFFNSHTNKGTNLSFYLCANELDEQNRWSLPRLNVARHLKEAYWNVLGENYFLTPCQCGYHHNEVNHQHHKKLSDTTSATSVSKTVNLHLRTVAAAVQTVRSLSRILTADVVSHSSHYAASGLAMTYPLHSVSSTVTQISSLSKRASLPPPIGTLFAVLLWNSQWYTLKQFTLLIPTESSKGKFLGSYTILERSRYCLHFRAFGARGKKVKGYHRSFDSQGSHGGNCCILRRSGR